MKELRCAIGADHRGYALKQYLLGQSRIGDRPIHWLDVGTADTIRTDYPPFAHAAVTLLREGKVERVVLLCGTGAGMAIAANRYPKVYAAVVWNPEIARRVREEDNVQCLVVPADYLTQDEVFECIAAWLRAEFKAGVYQQRLDVIEP